MEFQHPVLEKFWEDKYLVALMAVKFTFAALFIGEIYHLSEALNQNHCRYAVEMAEQGFEALKQ